MPKVHHRSLNRTNGHLTPTQSDYQCPHFQQRFIGHGVMNEKRAICDARQNVYCDYRHETSDGTPLCLRYWYGPQYEVIENTDPVYVQKVNESGYPLYYAADGTETIELTANRVMVSLSEAYPIPYIQGTMTTDPDTGESVATHPEFYSTQYEDTHEKVYDINGDIGWYKKV